MAKVYDVRQKDSEGSAEFLEWIMDAFYHYMHIDPEQEENSNTVALVFINHLTPDIRRKLQKLERLGEKSLRDLVEGVEKVYYNRETKGEKIKTGKIFTRDLAKSFWSIVIQTREIGSTSSRILLKGKILDCEIAHWKNLFQIVVWVSHSSTQLQSSRFLFIVNKIE